MAEASLKRIAISRKVRYFSCHKSLRGYDEEGIRGVFTNSVLDFYQVNLHLCTEGNGDRFIYYHRSRKDRSDNLIEPRQIKGLLAEGFRLFRLFSYSR